MVWAFGLRGRRKRRAAARGFCDGRQEIIHGPRCSGRAGARAASRLSSLALTKVNARFALQREHALHHALQTHASSHTETMKHSKPSEDLSRRFFLAGLALAGQGSAAAAGQPLAARLPASMHEPGGADFAYGTPSVHEKEVLRSHHAPAGFAIWRTPLQLQRGVITASGLHFAVHHSGLANIDPRTHVLKIHGRVRRPLRFQLEDLMRYPMVSRVHFLECAGNSAANALSPLARDETLGELSGEVSCAEWTGVPLAVLLEEARLEPDALWVVAEGADAASHARSLPLAPLLQDAMVALYQNGERLRPSQGYPMRLLMPGWEGNTSIKWLHRLQVAQGPAWTKDESGMYTQVLADGRVEHFALTMPVKSVITHPSGQQRLPQQQGYFQIEGLAWSGHGRIARVEVSVDGGEHWRDADLQMPVLDRAFTRFTMPWRWEGRAAVLMSRATDELGTVQPLRAQWKKRYASYSFNHYNAVQAWSIGADGGVRNSYA